MNDAVDPMTDGASGVEPGTPHPAVSSGRVRVTARPRTVRAAPLVAASDAGPTETSALYLRTLIRAQLRLGITLAAGFALTLAVASVLVASTPVLHTRTIGGVPWAWALQAFGMYPIVAVFALLYVRAARRNERRYRSLESQR